MKKTALIFLLMFVTSPVFAKPQVQSAFVSARREAFQSSYAMCQDKGLARELGYGTGIYIEDGTEKPFEWYAWTVIDGFVQFQFNVLVSYGDRYKIMVETDSISDRPWDARSEDYETCLGIDNSWASCLQKNNCNYKTILDSYLVKFERFIYFKEMKVNAYY